jgi:hypothetical protein
MKKVLIFGFLLILSSCATDIYKLNRFNNYEEIVYGVVMSGYNSVYTTDDNSIELTDTASTAIALPDETQMQWDFGVDFSNNVILDVFLRTTSSDYYTNSNNINIRFDSENSTLSIYENTKLVKSQKYNYNNELKRIKIDDYENKIKVSIDCDDVIYHTTNLANTEYLIFRNNKLDTIKVSAISALAYLKKVL